MNVFLWGVGLLFFGLTTIEGCADNFTPSGFFDLLQCCAIIISLLRGSTSCDGLRRFHRHTCLYLIHQLQ
jgi:hypothetical protein